MHRHRHWPRAQPRGFRGRSGFTAFSTPTPLAALAALTALCISSASPGASFPRVPAPSAPALSAPAAATDSVLVVTYLESRSDAQAQAAQRLHRYATLEHAASSAAEGAGYRLELLQEIARPECWVLLESSPSEAKLSSIEARGAEVLHSLQEFLVAPPDRRSNHVFRASSARPARTEDGASAIYAVTHLDVAADTAAAGRSAAEAVRQFIQAARASPGNLRAAAWQQDGHDNHYAIVLQWASPRAQHAFADGSATRSFRERIAPLLGSPWIEQLYDERD